MTRATIRQYLPARSALSILLTLTLLLGAVRSIDVRSGEARGGTHGDAIHLPMAQSTAANAASDGPRPATVVRPLSCTPLPDVPGKSMTTVLVAFPPGAYTAAHRHPGSVTAFVVSGTVRSQMAGGPPQDFTKGQTWFEPPLSLHLFAENPSPSEPASLLATFIADDGCTKLVIPEHLAG